MNSKLRAMLVAVGVFTLGGVGFYVSTPQPASRTMGELRDAGLIEGQKFTMVCPERLTKRTKNRIERKQPGLLRPKQSYARLARVGVCFNPDAGNCFRPSDGALRVADLEGEVVVPSLRRDVVGAESDGGSDDDGEDTDVDDAFQYQVDGCSALTCSQTDDAVDAGTFTNPYVNRFCGALNRLALQPSSCMIANGWRADGGWCEEACGLVDCQRVREDGGLYWFGFNVIPRAQAAGAACIPVECSVVYGDIPSEWL